MIHPLRGEVWLVKLDPTVGEEIQKTRPAVVISSTALLNYGTRIIVPITGWKESAMARRPWFVPLSPDALNGLDKPGAAACHHIRSLSLERFMDRHGRLAAEDLADVMAGIQVTLDIRVL